MARTKVVPDAAVLDAVGQEIGAVGPSALTLAGVGRRVGLAPATLLQRFGSRRNLLLAFSRAASDPAAALARAESPGLSRLDVLLRGLLELSGPVATPAAMANNLAMLHLDVEDAELRAGAQRWLARLEDWLREILDRAAADGELVEADTARLAATLLTTYNGALVTWAVRQSGALADDLADRVDAVLAPYRPPRPPAAEGGRR